MRVLLTGASGYIGQHLVHELLRAGHELTALVRAPSLLDPLRHERLAVVGAELEGSTRVAQALEGHEVCVHAALIWGEPGSEFELRDTAVAAKLFHAAGHAGVRRCLYLSSVAVHRPFRPEMKEDDPLSTADLYGATKAAGELMLRAACATFGMTGVVLRPGPVVGPPARPGGPHRSDHRLAALVEAAREGRPIEVRRGEGRQWTDVCGLARATRLLVEAPDPHPTWLCLDRAVLRWEWIARRAVERLGSASEVRVQEGDEVAPRFCTDRIEGLLGGPGDARSAMLAHLDLLGRGG